MSRMRLLAWISRLATLGVVAAVLRRSGIGLTAAALDLPLPVHFGAVAAVGVAIACRAGRLALLAGVLRAPIPLGTAILAQLAGDAAGAITPSRAGCEPAKLLVLHRDRVDLVRAGVALLGELVAEAAGLILIVAALVLLLPATLAVASGALVYGGGVLLATAGGLLIARLPAGGRLPTLVRRSRPMGSRSMRRVHAAALRSARHLRRLGRIPPPALLGVTLLTLLHILARLAILPLLLAGSSPGADLAPLIAWPLLLLYGGALVPTPGGGGTIEAGFALGLAAVLPATGLAATMIWWRFYTYYLTALLGGLVLLLTRRRERYAASDGRATREPLSGDPATTTGSSADRDRRRAWVGQ